MVGFGSLPWAAPGTDGARAGSRHVRCIVSDAGAVARTHGPGAPDPNAGQLSRVRPEKTKLPTRELEKMSNSSETQDAPKNRSWMYLVAAFIVLIVIGVLTT